MTFCPIYKGGCPENAGECTFWNVTIVPAQKSKRCAVCVSPDWSDCDYCDGCKEEHRIEGCTLKHTLGRGWSMPNTV